MANTTITVSNSAQLSAALKSATGGETIVLSSGNYGDFNISNAKFSSEVTIVSANPDKMAVFDTITVQNSTNITFDSVDVDFKPTVNTYSHESAFMISGSSDITVRNSHIEGENAKQNGVDSIAGYPVGRGMTVQNSSDVVLEGNDISYFHKGIITISSERLDILNNSIENLRLSHIAGADVHDVTIEGNYLGAVRPHNYGGAGDHGDYIHFWILDGQAKNSSDIHIADNFFAQGDGLRMMGVYLEDHWDTTAKFTNVVIDNNLFHLADHQSILIEGAQGVAITNNTMLQSGGAPNDAPGVVLSVGVKGVVLDSNIFSQPVAIMDNNVQVVQNTNNLVVQYSNPNGANYAGSYFPNVSKQSPDISDLQPSQNIGRGASLTEAGPGSSGKTPDRPAPQQPDNNDGGDTGQDPVDQQPPVSEKPGTGGDSGNTGGNDGNSGNTGGSKPPSNDNGPSEPVDTTVLIRADMNGKAGDNANASSSVRYVDAGDRTAVKLNGGNIAYDADDRFLNNSAYTLSFDFKKEAGAENASGYAIYFSSSFVVKINADSITAAVISTKGVNWVTLDNIDIKNTDWHQLTLTFSGETGKAVFYVDGKEAGVVSGLEGAVQQGSPWHDFHVGGEFGDSFNGLIDNVSFEQGAITAKQAAEAYQGSIGDTDKAPDPDPVDVVDETPAKPEQPVEDPKVEDPKDEDPKAEDPKGDNDNQPGAGDGDDTPDTGELPNLNTEQEIAALNQAASDFGSGVHNLGRGDEYFGQDDFTASITFALDSLDDGRQRLLWNHMNYGVQIENDDLMIYFAEDGANMKIYTFPDVIKDTDWHDVQLVLNDSADSFSIYLDGQQLKVQDGVTGGVSEPKWWDVTVGGTEFQDANEFKGQIADFSILDHAVEIDSDMSVFERTAYIDSFDDMHHANLDLIGVALHEDQLNFA